MRLISPRPLLLCSFFLFLLLPACDGGGRAEEQSIYLDLQQGHFARVEQRLARGKRDKILGPLALARLEREHEKFKKAFSRAQTWIVDAIKKNDKTRAYGDGMDLLSRARDPYFRTALEHELTYRLDHWDRKAGTETEPTRVPEVSRGPEVNPGPEKEPSEGVSEGDESVFGSAADACPSVSSMRS